MALLPLSSGTVARHAGDMSTTTSQFTRLLGQLARAVAGIVEECNYATRRMMELRTAPDRYVLNPDNAPDNYAEFLYRTSGVLTHEPAARDRARAAARAHR
jgi:hypothetical protein